MTKLRARLEHRAGERESGQISLLIVGLFAVVALLILGGIDLTVAQLARLRLVDAVDAAAWDAADAVDMSQLYSGGTLASIPLSEASVRQSVAEYLAARPMPDHVTSWSIAPGTGTPDGRTAYVVVTAQVRLPMSGWIQDLVGSSVTITVDSRATSPVVNP